MSDDRKFAICLFGIIVGTLFGVILGTVYTSSAFQQEAIKRGYAEYNSQTGKWHWKTDLVVEKRENE